MLSTQIMSSNGEPEGIISHLPMEILSHIFSDVCLESTDLFCLSLVCKRFSQAVQRKLYHRIDLNPDQPMTAEKLLKGLSENVQLLPLVRHLKLRFLPGWDWVALPEKLNLAFEQILRLHLPALESLAYESTQISKSIYDVNPMLPVRSIYVNQISREHAATLMLLPCVEEIHIGSFDDMAQGYELPSSSSIPSTLRTRRSRFARLKEIRIDTGFVPSIFLSPFVEWPRLLRSFHGSITICETLSPISIDRYLEPVKDTLTHLSLLAHTDYHTPIDGTFIYFQNFVHLTYLNTTASLLFNNDNWYFPSKERTGLYRRLPTTLKTLKVFFDLPSMAVDTGREEVYLGIETPRDYLWILELTNLPNLESLDLEEQLDCTYGAPHYKSFQWVPPNVVLNALNSSDITFKALLRSYKQHAIATDERRTRITMQREARVLARTVRIL